MAAYLRDTVTGEAVSPIFLQQDDAEEAQAGSEFLELDTWMAQLAVFPARRGIGYPPRTVDVFTPMWTAMKLRHYEQVFYEACELPG